MTTETVRQRGGNRSMHGKFAAHTAGLMTRVNQLVAEKRRLQHANALLGDQLRDAVAQQQDLARRLRIATEQLRGKGETRR